MPGKSLPDEASRHLEVQYNNRAAVPEHPALMAAWRDAAEAARAAHPPSRVAYGPGQREVIDLFEANAGAPVVMFIHGGYWQALDKSWFSGLAPAFLSHGLTLAIPNYDLCPGVSLGKIVEQMRMATRTLHDRTGHAPVVTGHSAGGHLAACLLSEGRTSAAVAISGVFDLLPLIPTSINVALKLDPTEARTLSPLHWPAPGPSAVLDCLVGGAETDEFIRQSRDMAEAWGRYGVQTRFEALNGLNHFTVLEPLATADSPLMNRIARLAKQ